ncbi:MAG: rhomboid family intramembrane serine protease [Pseudomonadales bacterium]|nr:rhomboid family intramembrane serine protease [Pseudomonadales bacterium]
MLSQISSSARTTITVLALFIIVFLLLQHGDIQREQSLLTQYHDTLLQREWPYYPTRLLSQGQSSLEKHLEQQMQRGHWQSLANRMGADSEFVQHLSEDGHNYMDAEQYNAWELARQAYDHQRNHLSSVRLGVDPQKNRPITYLTALFLNHGWPGLIISLLLFLSLALPLEIQYGGSRMMLMFLIPGILGNLIHDIHIDHDVFPYYGPQTGIAGLMGAWCAHAFRQRLWPWFRGRVGPFPLKLPVILPPLLGLAHMAWMAWRWQYPAWDIWSDVGALVCGLGLGWFMNSAVQPSTKPISEEQESTLSPVKELEQTLDQAFQAMGESQYNHAEKLLRYLYERHPTLLNVMLPLYHIIKRTPNAESAALLRKIFNSPEGDIEQHWRLLRVYKEGIQQGTVTELDAESQVRLMIRFAQIDALKEADFLAKEALQQKPPHPLLAQALRALSSSYMRQENSFMAKKYQDQIQHLKDAANAP